MTTAQKSIKRQVMRWSAAAKIDLAEQLLESIKSFADSRIGEAWDREIADRIGDIENKAVTGISAERVRVGSKKSIARSASFKSVQGSNTQKIGGANSAREPRVKSPPKFYWSLLRVTDPRSVGDPQHGQFAWN